MRLSFRQGVVSHQITGGQSFLSLVGGGDAVNIAAANRPTVVTIAHHNTNYIWSEDESVPGALTADPAWVGPFDPSQNYWLFWDFDQITFQRAFGYTALEPIAGPTAPEDDYPTILDVVPGGSPNGYFEVAGHYVLPTGRGFEVIQSTGNDGFYTVTAAIYDTNTARTSIYVEEVIPNDVIDGALAFEFDNFNQPLYQEGRHWFNTTTSTHYVLVGARWVERLRVFAARLNNLTFSPLGGKVPPDFTGTQVGLNVRNQSGRVVFDSSGMPIQKDDGTFFTTEDQFFANASRVDAIRLESNVARAQCGDPNIAAFTVVAWTDEDLIQQAIYDNVGRGDAGADGLAIIITYF